MIKVLFIGAGGFFGAISRYWVSGWMYQVMGTRYPVGTLVVNLLGSFLLGVFMAFFQNHIVHPNLRVFITIGLLGAFTTFSTFSYETVVLLQLGSYASAFMNIVVSVLLGVACAMAGLFVGNLI